MPRFAALIAVFLLIVPAVAQERAAPDPPSLEVGVPLEAEITESDTVIETATLLRGYTDAPVRGKSFRLEVEESGSYHVDLRSWFFDAYLVLRDAEGNVLAEDDDGLIGTHARIVRTLEAGASYRVDACALHGGVGDLEVAVRPGTPKELSPPEKARMAIEDGREGIRRLEALRGPDHLDVASSLNNLGARLEIQGHFSEARPLYERSLGILEKSLGPDHPDVATSLNNLGVLLKIQGHFSEARPFYERSLAIYEKALGPDHPNVATSLNNLANLLRSQGLYAEARPLCERSLAIKEKSLGPDHPDVALSLNSLAELLISQGQYAEARPLHEKSLAIREKSLGPDHPAVATSLDNLGILLRSQGLYAEARPLHERSLAIREQSLGPDHPSVARSLNNLGVLFKIQGLFSEARPLYERSLAISEKALGPDHPDVTTSLSNLAELLRIQGQYSEARPLVERSLAIWEKSLGPDHPDVATALNNLAVLLRSQGEYAEARPLYERSLAIREKSLGPDHPDVATALNNLAEFLWSQGQYAEARPLYERALASREKSFGPDHPDVASSLNNLALLEADLGQGEKARALSRRALVSRERHLEATLWSQSESERLRFAAKMTDVLETYLSLDGGSGRTKSAVASDDVVAAVLSFKGKVARSLLLSGVRQLAALPPGERALVEEVRSVQKGLSDALYEREVADREAHGRRLEELRRKRNELEVALARSRGEREGKGEKERGNGWERGEEAAALRRALPEGAVAVDLLVHGVYEPAEWKGQEVVRKGRWTSRVSAFVVRPGVEDIPWLDLGEAAVLEEATKAFLEELVTRRGIDVELEEEAPSTTPATDRLRELLFDPLREAIGDAELVIVSPDTFLGTLPLETLQEKDGSYLVEKRGFVYVQDLLSLIDREHEGADSQRLLAAGGIDYGRRGKLDPGVADAALVALNETRGGLPPRWSRLSATGQEADAVAGLFEETTEEEGACALLLGKEATEEAIKRQLSRHTHVHLATHGYFQPEGLPSAWKKAREEAEKDRGGAFLEETEKTITGLLPGLLSGLVFAGANAELEKGRDNGLLTAEEVTYLDLSRCELVVLSACETGLGRPEGGEGMIGLRRSFRQAGARTVISSLWKVRDDSTQELMERFYENLWLRNMGKLEALRSAQLWMLDRNRKESGDGLPSTWGAFVLDGDWE